MEYLAPFSQKYALKQGSKRGNRYLFPIFTSSQRFNVGNIIFILKVFFQEDDDTFYPSAGKNKEVKLLNKHQGFNYLQ